MRAAASGAIVLLGASTVSAQIAGQAPGDAGAQGEITREPGRFHIGMLTLTPIFGVRELGIDSNVFNTPDDSRSDFTATFRPQLEASADSRRLRLSTSAIVDFVYYKTYASERSINTDIKSGAELVLSRRFTLFAQDDFLNTRSRPSLEIDIRPRHTSNVMRAGSRVSLSKKLSVEVFGEHGRTEYDEREVFFGTTLQDTLNQNRTGGGVNVLYAVTPLTTVSFGGEKADTRFPNEPVRDNERVQYSLGFTFKPRALIKGDAHIGMQRLRADDSQFRDRTGTIADVSVSYTLLEATTFTVQVDRGTQYSFEILEPYYVASGLGLIVRRHLAGRYDVSVGAHHFENEYQALLIPGREPTPERIETLRSYAVTVGYRVGRSRVEVGGTYWDRESSRSEIRGFEGIRFISNFSYGF
jgi:hypothetical protein